MKKFIIIITALLVLVSCREDDPHNYEGCLIVSKNDMPYYNFKVKLTPKLRDSLKTDYKTFYTVKYEWEKYEVGNIIK